MAQRVGFKSPTLTCSRHPLYREGGPCIDNLSSARWQIWPSIHIKAAVFDALFFCCAAPLARQAEWQPLFCRQSRSTSHAGDAKLNSLLSPNFPSRSCEIIMFLVITNTLYSAPSNNATLCFKKKKCVYIHISPFCVPAAPLFKKQPRSFKSFPPLLRNETRRPAFFFFLSRTFSVQKKRKAEKERKK